ncbi:arylsulfatase [Echinicola jeungdonensis]|uniref:Arylsulfatase n=1 Tax=Echinicola jeungdonensis TaxID=709343 RepID=A0ABV5JA26_9BACT
MMNKNLNLVCFALTLVFASCQPDKKDSQSQEIKPPNIIFILADDLGYGDLSCYGQEKFETPHIDQLAASGMKFTSHYAGTSVCAPSRASLLTGFHTGHVPIRDNKSLDPAPYGQREREGQWPLADSVKTMPEILQENGYVTGAFGKWGLGGPGTEGEPNNQGFDQFSGFVCQSLAHNYYPFHLWNNQTKVDLPENSDGQFGAYSPDLIQEQTLKFIEDNQENPFFLFVPTALPHAELIAPEEEMSQFEENLEEGKPYEGVDSGPAFRKGALASQDKPHAAFAAMIKVLDNQVGEIMEKVKELGMEENTIIIFTSDNGPHHEGGGDPEFFNGNGPFRGIKRDLYEGGIRVPLIVSWKGKIAENSTSDHVSAFWDFLPTFAEIAGFEKKTKWDGVSFLPELTGNSAEQKEHDYLYWEYHGEAGKQAARIGKWKGVRTGIREGNRTIELFDLEADPGETNNIASEHPDMVQKIQNVFKEAHQTNQEFKLGYLDEQKNE